MSSFSKFCTSLFTLFIFSTGFQAMAQSNLPGGLRGNVQEYGSQMPLEYALVVVNADAKAGLTQALSAYTNSDGYFQINGIPAGTYDVTVKMAGFKDITRSISVKAGRIGFERFLLEESTVVLEDVVIDVKRQEQQTKVATAVVQLSPKSITTFSIGGEPDLMRALQVLPGVITTGDQGGQLYSRGGAPIQNVV
jgi:hypothetical protein